MSKMRLLCAKEFAYYAYARNRPGRLFTSLAYRVSSALNEAKATLRNNKHDPNDAKILLAHAMNTPLQSSQIFLHLDDEVCIYLQHSASVK